MNLAFVHLELNTDDVERARAFYREVVGWDFREVPVGGQRYTQISTPHPPAGGIQIKPQAKMPSHWLPYVGVSDVKETVRRAREAGARIIADYSEVPGHGALAIITDPSGAAFGVWQLETPAKAAAGPKKVAQAKPAAKKKVAKAKAAAKKKVVKAKPVAKKKVAKAKPVAKKKVAKAKPVAKKKVAKAKPAAKKKVAKAKPVAKKKVAKAKPAAKKKVAKAKPATKGKAAKKSGRARRR